MIEVFYHKIKGRYFHSIKQFIDDLSAIKYNREFGCNNPEIYCKELELKLKHQATHTFFLDLDFNIVDEKFVYNMYRKKDHFPFFFQVALY